MAFEVIPSNKGTNALVYNNYKYTIRGNRSSGTEIFWTCSTNRGACNASLKTDADITAILSESRVLHRHPPLDDSEIINLKIRNRVKKKSVEDISAVPRKIISRAVANSEDVKSCEAVKLRRVIYRYRKKMVPIESAPQDKVGEKQNNQNSTTKGNPVRRRQNVIDTSNCVINGTLEILDSDSEPEENETPNGNAKNGAEFPLCTPKIEPKTEQVERKESIPEKFLEEEMLIENDNEILYNDQRWCSDTMSASPTPSEQLRPDFLGQESPVDGEENPLGDCDELPNGDLDAELEMGDLAELEKEVETKDEEAGIEEADENNETPTVKNDDAGATSPKLESMKEEGKSETKSENGTKAEGETKAENSFSEKVGDTEETKGTNEDHQNSTTPPSRINSPALTIRSASDLNKMVIATKVKTEKVEPCEESSGSEKPHGGISILNPAQLGATTEAGAANLLQNVSYSQDAPSTEMMYMGMQNDVVMQQRCDVCDTQFPDAVMLEEHRATAGHYKCIYGPECQTLIFGNVSDLNTHQQSMHGGLLAQTTPVQQLTQQVQSMPARYQIGQMAATSYQVQQQYGSPMQTNVRAPVYQQNNITYSPQANVQQIRQYSPRSQGPRLTTPVSMNSTKRGAITPPSRITPTKRTRTVDSFNSRNGDSMQKPEDDVVSQLSKSITITTRQESQKKNDAVANILANRGITVSSVPAKNNRNASGITMLNLNSAVSIIPTNTNKNTAAVTSTARNGGRQATNTGRMATVDLTGPEQRNRQGTTRQNRFQCTVCDRSFFSQDQLNQHMTTHRSGTRRQLLPYRCNLCTAQYPTQQGLVQHKQNYHRGGDSSTSNTNEMVIPIVDVKQEGAVQRMRSMGITHMIPLNALGSNMDGSFGVPILPLSSEKVVGNMTNCGVSNILPLGPLRALR